MRRLRPEKFSTVVADVPWAFDDKLPGKTRGAERNYQVMRPESAEVFLDVTGIRDSIADDALLFFWRVASMQHEALRVVEAWGFELKSEMVWAKTTSPVSGHAFFEQFDAGKVKLAFGMGRYVRNCHETCLIARRGKARVLSRSVRSMFFAPLGKHSEKPDLFYEIVEALGPPPRLELFARKRRPGWTQHGLELES